MTLTEITASNLLFLTAADVAPVLGCDPQSIRVQAHTAPRKLGFPVVVTGRRVRIPRQGFIAFCEGRPVC